MKPGHDKIFVAIMTAAGLLVVVGLFVTLMLPTLQDIKELSQKIIQVETEIQAQYANRKNLVQTGARIEEAKKSLARIGAQFIDEGQELDFITATEDIAAKNGLESNRRVDLGSGRQQLTEFDRSFELDLSGPFLPVLKAIIDLQRMPAITVIDTLSMHGSGLNISVMLHGRIASPPNELTKSPL